MKTDEKQQVIQQPERVFNIPLGTLLQIEPVLDFVSKKDYNGQIIMNVRNNIKQLKAEIKEFINFRLNLVQKYGTEIKPGVFEISENSPNREKIKSYLEETLDNTIITYYPKDVPLSIFAKFSEGISSEALDLLVSIGFIVKDDPVIETTMTSAKYITEFEKYMKDGDSNENKERNK